LGTCLCESHEVPPQSPLWGYQSSPGINKYDSFYKEFTLGDYFDYTPTQGELPRKRTTVSERPVTPPPAAYVVPEGKTEEQAKPGCGCQRSTPPAYVAPGCGQSDQPQAAPRPSCGQPTPQAEKPMSPPAYVPPEDVWGDEQQANPPATMPSEE
jgi:hypothetical protein